MKATLRILAATLLALPGMLSADEAKIIMPKPKPKIQLAILLDTSNSMDGLIAQAKAHLWTVVNEFATAKRGGVQPTLQVALYEYGKSSLPGGEGHLRQILPLTDDLDRVSKELFDLKTNGGNEFCGWVINDAVSGLQWSKDNRDLKAIFIAGNEPFTQGKVNYVTSCKGAIAKSILVNTIHCGSYDEGVRGKWKAGADLADGSYINIDQNKAIVRISAPQDKKIAELNAQLNGTYVPYGAKGAARAEEQKRQDSNAKTMAPSAVAQRAQAKSSSFYKNSGWDLVDAVKENKVDLKKVKKDALPKVMQNMTHDERKAYVEKQQKQRATIQAEITKLGEARKTHVAAEMKKRVGNNKEKSLDDAMVEALKKQAKKKNFTFK